MFIKRKVKSQNRPNADNGFALGFRISSPFRKIREQKEKQKKEAAELMDKYGDEALQSNILVAALMQAKDRYTLAAGKLKNPDAIALVKKLASTAQDLAEAVKKAGR